MTKGLDWEKGTFRAYQVTKEDLEQRPKDFFGKGRWTTLPLSLKKPASGEVLIKSSYSSVNFKDALGATGKGRIFKKLPIIPGIDVSGVVAASADPRFKGGEEVLVTGCGMGETHDGGMAEYVCVPAEWVVPLPPGLSLEESMILGTAGFTAALALHRMEENGQHPSMGKILITGASGGVGGLATLLFSSRGYSVTAVSGKPQLKEFLLDLGASEVHSLEELQLGNRPLESSRWAGAIDNLGGEALAKILAHLQLQGNVASIGLALDASLSTTVMPFILRGNSLLGISSANCPYPLREKLWKLLAKEWKSSALGKLVTATVDKADDGLNEIFTRMIARRTHGRTLVKLF